MSNNTQAKVLVIAEHLDGKLNASTAKTVSAAAAVNADAIDVVVLAADPTAIAAEAAQIAGVAKVLTVANTANAEAASAMALGSTMAGFVISNTGTGNDHAIARALGGLFDTPHGLATGLLLPHVMRFNAPARPARYRRIAEALGMSTLGGDVEVGDRVCDEVSGLVRDVGVPDRLGAIDIDRARVPELVAIALKNVGPNPRRTSSEDMRALIESAF